MPISDSLLMSHHVIYFKPFNECRLKSLCVFNFILHSMYYYVLLHVHLDILKVFILHCIHVCYITMCPLNDPYWVTVMDFVHYSECNTTE